VSTAQPPAVGAAERLARAAVGAIAEPGRAVLLRAVAATSAEAVVDALRHGHGGLDPDGRLRTRLAGLDPAAVLAEATARHIRFVVPGDREWPAGLEDLTRVDRDGVGGVPAGLWVRGACPLDTMPRLVAIVGSRAASVYGTQVASELALGLAERGWAVVSGAAYGIDAAAHRGALVAGGRTVAVLAGGVDLPYPRGHAHLLDRVADAGAVVSEVPPGRPVSRHRFLVRNRLVAAAAAGLVVVEAGFRSGARSTAAWADALARPVGAVPGPVSAATSALPHRLVRDGQATLVTGVDEVLELLSPIGEAMLPLDPPAPASPWDGLGDDATAVGAAFPGRGATSVAELVAATGLDVPRVVLGLEDLARAGVCSGDGDRWQLTRVGRRPSGDPSGGPQAWRP
jgi:DNA processing protein